MRLFGDNLRKNVAAFGCATLFALPAIDGFANENAGIGATPGAALTAVTPGMSALRLALAEPGTPESAAAHYRGADFEKIWFRAGGDDSAARALIEAVRTADRHGLPVARYDAPLLEAALAASADDPAARAVAELAMTRAFLTYARDLSSGLLEPRSVDRDLHVKPARPDEAALLARVAAASDAAAFLESLAPQSAEYQRLLGELSSLTALAPDAWGPPVAEGGSLRLDDVSDRVAAMRARLIAKGDHSPAATAAIDVAAGTLPADESTPTSNAPAADLGADPRRFDVALEESVRAFQRRHGLNDDGVAGRRTIAALNAGVQQRIGQVLVSLERLRWMNRDLGHRHVHVNMADFTVKLVEGGEVLFRERVVIGKARKHRTPEFSDEMQYMVFNPVWHVPYSIASEEILPKLREDPEYLAKKNMRLLTRDGGAGPDPALHDWSLYSTNDFPYLIKQGSGGGNALGRVKFMFPNQFSIYLHDTPSKRLFNKDARAFSHGCVRVRDPMAFARALLAPQVEDPAAFVERQLARSGERHVNLRTPVPVHLTYLTAWVDEAGVWQFRDDVYGRDGRILAALTSEGVTPPAAGG